jgi:hypothetical protein
VRPASAAVLGLAVLLLCALPATAASPLHGTVKRGFTANGEFGRIATTFPATTAHIYASFVWLRAPSAGQKLEIDWFGPTGRRIAAWKDRTLASDTAGTRIFSFIPRNTIAKRPGRWRVAIVVGGVERGSLRFTVAKPKARAKT